jgi:L-ascorbate metabolism protein UlaG (beta-lactamase superfamily)
LAPSIGFVQRHAHAFQKRKRVELAVACVLASTLAAVATLILKGSPMNRHGRYIALLLYLSAFCSLSVGFSAKQNEVKVTYIANEGFMIQAGSDKIVVDGLFYDDKITFCDVPSEELLAQIEKGVPPFADIDLLLVTHWHLDHFNSSSVSRFLRNNPKCKLVCPSQVRKEIQDKITDYADIEDQITVPVFGSDFIKDTTVNQIKIKALRLHHGSYFIKDEKSGKEYDKHEKVENLGYVVELSGRTILHVGDASLRKDQEIFKNLGIPIDIVFVEGYEISEESLQIISTYIKPEHIIYMHLPKQDRQRMIDLITTRNPAGTIFAKPLEEKCFQ